MHCAAGKGLDWTRKTTLSHDYRHGYCRVLAPFPALALFLDRFGLHPVLLHAVLSHRVLPRRPRLVLTLAPARLAPAPRSFAGQLQQQLQYHAGRERVSSVSQKQSAATLDSHAAPRSAVCHLQ